RLIGDPTEGALIAMAAKARLRREELERDCERLLEIPFDADRKRMSTINARGEGFRILVKGAPDILLRLSTEIQDGGRVRRLSAADAEQIEANIRSFAGQALRVLGFAYRDAPSLPHDVSPATVERDLVFAGLAGIIDPPRSEAKEAVLAA